MAYLLQWVMIYSFRINTDLGINPNSIPYPVKVLIFWYAVIAVNQGKSYAGEKCTDKQIYFTCQQLGY